MSRLGRVHALMEYLRVLQTPRDVLEYAALRRLARLHGGDRTPRPLRVRALGGRTVLCRPTQDVWTFKFSFLEPFHLPPAPLPDGATIVDLGANVGYTVADLAWRHPTARVIGVEMDAENFALARRNTAWLGPRVELVHAAVWSEDGEVAYGGEDDDAFAVIADGGEAAPSARRVPAVSMETLLAARGIERVDYLKMDVEGAEAAILGGPCDWLDVVQSAKIEVHPPATAEACCAVLEAHGLHCRSDPDHWSCIDAVRDAAASPHAASMHAAGEHHEFLAPPPGADRRGV